ncbi:MAG: 2-oxo acid dehydrogenase subunit E2 [Chloroflexi bacterium]|nr:2-oxo acid dehydrogenase subunit E2 [Chloroflexota bacterium]
MSKGGELMATELYIPKQGQTVEEVTIIEWLAADGAKVAEGQEILNVETDKAVFAVEATAAGYLHRGPFAEGQVVPVLTVVATIGKRDEVFDAGTVGRGDAGAGDGAEARSVAEPSGASLDQPVTASPSERIVASPRARKRAAEERVPLAEVTPTGGGGIRVVERDVLAYLASAPKASPLAAKLAAGAGIDLRKVAGTGPGGKITKEDVEAAIAQAASRLPPPAAPVVAVAAEAPIARPAPAALPSAEVVERIPLKGVRAIIADRMAASVHTSARVTLMMEVDATEFVAVRERLKAKVEKEWGFAPGYNDLLALIVAAGLRRFSYMNARLASDAQGSALYVIERLAHVNLGMAVDTERGLLVPVIRDADQKSLRQFGQEFREMVDRARKGKSLPDDLSGGTFTITNLGMYGIEGFTPVINLPEAAILGVGRIIPKWVYHPSSPDKPALRQMMTLSLVFDHRVVDGAPAARFLQYIKELVEEPLLLLAA